MVKRSKIVAHQPKTLENPNTVDIKSATIEHPKTDHKLFKTIRQAEKVSQVSGAEKKSTSPWYSHRKKGKIFWTKKMQKVTKNNYTFTEVMQILIMLKFWNCLILNNNLRLLDSQLKMN